MWEKHGERKATNLTELAKLNRHQQYAGESRSVVAMRMRAFPIFMIFLAKHRFHNFPSFPGSYSQS